MLAGRRVVVPSGSVHRRWERVPVVRGGRRRDQNQRDGQCGAGARQEKSRRATRDGTEDEGPTRSAAGSERTAARQTESEESRGRDQQAGVLREETGETVGRRQGEGREESGQVGAGDSGADEDSIRTWRVGRIQQQGA